MHTRILFCLFLFQSIYGMQQQCLIQMDLMPTIIEYALGLDEFPVWRASSTLKAIKCNYELQLVCKNFKHIFSDCTRTHWYYVIQDLINSSDDDRKFEPWVMKLLVVTIDRIDVNLADPFGIWPVYIDEEGSKYTEKETLLQKAIKRGSLQMVKLLLSCPVIDVNKNTLLFQAVFSTREKLQLLLAHSDIQINVVNKQGETALFEVARGRFYEIDGLSFVLDTLIKAGIDHTIKNKKGETALDVVRQHASNDVIREFEKAFAIEKNS